MKTQTDSLALILTHDQANELKRLVNYELEKTFDKHKRYAKTDPHRAAIYKSERQTWFEIWEQFSIAELKAELATLKAGE